PPTDKLTTQKKTAKACWLEQTTCLWRVSSARCECSGKRSPEIRRCRLATHAPARMHAPSAWVQWTPTPEPTHPLPSPQTGLSSPTACANGRGVLLPTPTAQNASRRLKNALHVKLVDDRFQELRNGPRFSQLIPVCRANRHCIFSRDQATCLRVTRLKVQDSITLLDHVGGSVARNVVA